MSKFTSVLLLSALLIAFGNSLTIGSCLKQSLDGQKCEQCVDNYHLNDGNCFVDILGCKEYMFGNICHECSQGYILVNNLCCDHNCMAKLLSRSSAADLSEEVRNNFEYLSIVIPYINVHYLNGTVNVMLEIETQNYIDVIRFVILYQIPSSKWRFRRAIVDFVKNSSQVVGIDWSVLADQNLLMEFHSQQLQIKNNTQLSQILAIAYNPIPKVVLAKLSNFTEMQQYQVVSHNEETEKIIIQIFYILNSKRILLISEEKAMPDFIPTQKKIPYEEFDLESQNNPSFKLVLSFVMNDTNYSPTFQYAIIQHKTRYTIEYIFFIQSETHELTYYLLLNLKNNNVKIIDFESIEKKVVNEVVENIKDAINNNGTQPKNLTQEEEKIVEIVGEAIEQVVKDKEEEKELTRCQGVDCTKREETAEQLEKEEIKIITIFREYNPKIVSFEVIQQWAHDFATFTEWTLLIRVRDPNSVVFYFFHVLLFKVDESVLFWGQTETAEPQKDESGHFVLPNRQSNVPQSEVTPAVEKIHSEFPESVEAPVSKALLRESPENRKRFTIVLRLETTKVRYVVLSNSTNTWIQEHDIIESGLAPLTPEEFPIIETEQKVQVIIDNTNEGKQIPEQSHLTPNTSITIPSTPVGNGKQEEPVEVVKKCQENQVEKIYNVEGEDGSVQVIKECQPKDQKQTELVQTIVDDLYLVDKSVIIEHPEKNLTDLVINLYPSSEIIAVWQNNHFQTYIEYTILLRTSLTFTYIHFFIWNDGSKILDLGSSSTDKVLKNSEGQYVVPNPENKLNGSLPQEVIEQIEQGDQRIVNSTMIKIVERKFPLGVRYTIFILTTTHSQIRYVVHVAQGQTVIVETEVIKQGVDIKEEIEKEIIETVIEEVEKDIKEEVEVDKCEGVDCTKREETAEQLEKEEIKIITIFREYNPKIVSFEVIQQWAHDFATFTEWTLLIRVRDPNSVVFYFFHVLLFKVDESVLFWGQTETAEPQKDESGHFVLPNRQSNVPQSEVTSAVEKIHSEFPESVEAPVSKALLRESPENRKRFTIVLRLETTKVRYVVLSNSTNTWIQEHDTIESGLAPLTPEEVPIIETEQELEVIAEEHLTNSTPTHPTPTHPNITIPVPTQPSTPTPSQNQTIIKTESPSEGIKTENVNVIGQGQKEILDRIIQFVKKPQNGFSQIQIQIITNQLPLGFVEQEFCDTADFIVIYLVDKVVYVFGFRASVLHPENLEFLGKFTFPRESLSFHEIISKATVPQIPLSQSQISSLILQSHPELPKDSQLEPEQVSYVQVGQTVRATIMIYINNFYTRFVMQEKSGNYTLVEECRLDKGQGNTTEVTVSGNVTQIITNDVDKIKNDDNVTKWVIEQIEKEIQRELVEPLIKITDYPNTTEYLVFENSTNTQIIFIIIKATNQTKVIIGRPSPVPVENYTNETIPEPLLNKTEQILEQIKNITNSSNLVIEEVVVDDDGVIEKIEETVKDLDNDKQYVGVGVGGKDDDEIIVEEVHEVGNQTEEPKEPANQTIVIDVEEVEKIIEEVIKQHNKTNATNVSTPKPEPSKNTTINPEDIEQVIKQVLNPHPEPQPKPILEFTKEEALEYLSTEKPEIEGAQLISENKETLPHLIKFDFTFETSVRIYHVTVTKNEQFIITLVSFVSVDKVSESHNGTDLGEVVKEVEEKDKQNYTPISPENPQVEEAKEIVNNGSSEPGRDLGNPSQDDKDLIEFIRGEVPLVKESEVIRIVGNEGDNIRVDFYVADKQQNYTYKVVEVIVKDNKIISVVEVVKNGEKVENVIEEQNKLDNFVNVAYGYETLDLKQALKNPSIQLILSQITKRYPNLTLNQQISEIQSLQLKSSKTNFILRYPEIYFTVFFDSVSQKILFLNQVSQENREQLHEINNSTVFAEGLKHFTGLHEELKDYQLLTSGQYTQGDWDVFSAELLAHGKKFRIVWKVNFKTGEKSQIMFTQMIEVALERTDLRSFVSVYQILSQDSYAKNQYLGLAVKFAKNKNPILKDAQILSVMYKTQNLGFNYKIGFLTEGSEIYETEVYVETFSQKFTQVQFQKLDFSSGFLNLDSSSEKSSRIVQKLQEKNLLQSLEITSISEKQFLLGSIVNVTAKSLENASQTFSGLFYINEGNNDFSVLTWGESNKQKCEIKNDQQICFAELTGCSAYGEAHLTCSVCKAGFLQINGLCTKDCGALCMAISFP